MAIINTVISSEEGMRPVAIAIINSQREIDQALDSNWQLHDCKSGMQLNEQPTQVEEKQLHVTLFPKINPFTSYANFRLFQFSNKEEV